jgi:hypothetical protein
MSVFPLVALYCFWEIEAFVAFDTVSFWRWRLGHDFPDLLPFWTELFTTDTNLTKKIIN